MASRRASTFRRWLIAFGWVLVLLFSLSIADSLLFGPRCKHCYSSVMVISRVDNQWITRTVWKCTGCGICTVDHFHKQNIDVPP